MCADVNARNRTAGTTRLVRLSWQSATDVPLRQAMPYARNRTQDPGETGSGSARHRGDGLAAAPPCICCIMFIMFIMFMHMLMWFFISASGFSI